MPMPEPKDDEEKDEFIDRCMSNETMKSEFEDNDQRLAVCQQIWDDEGENSMNDKIDKIERRHVSFDKLELREEGQGPGTLQGYSAVFNSETEIAGLFREKIAPGAFGEAIQDNVRALFNHNADHILGTTDAETLRLTEDSRGLRMEVDLPDTAVGRDLATSVKRGDITGQSFSFRVAEAEQEWHENDGDQLDLRVILKFRKVPDVGPVTFPAYEDTDISVARAEYRSWWQNKKQRQEKAEMEARKRREKETRRRARRLKVRRYRHEVEMDVI